MFPCDLCSGGRDPREVILCSSKGIVFRKLMTLVCPIPGHVDTDRLVKVVSARFLYIRFYTITYIEYCM